MLSIKMAVLPYITLLQKIGMRYDSTPGLLLLSSDCVHRHRQFYIVFFLYLQIAVMLLEGGANPDAKDHYEATAMHRAAAKGNLKMIHILLYYKASTNIQDTEGNTPL
jgi:ankyrin repeat protein